MAAIKKIRLVADKCPKPRKGKDCNRCMYCGLIESSNKIFCYYYDYKTK